MRQHYLPRREFLARAGGGIGALALSTLLASETKAQDPLAPKKPHFAPKAKRVISIFCFGGLSHMDTFDPKPELIKQDGVSVASRKEFRHGRAQRSGQADEEPVGV
jgi:Protein of unknown function (DUF1501)